MKNVSWPTVAASIVVLYAIRTLGASWNAKGIKLSIPIYSDVM